MSKLTVKLSVTFFFVCALTCDAAENLAGRWEGKIQVPGEELRVVIDLAQDSAGAWSGSITIPGLNLKGAALTEIALKGPDLNFTVKNALTSPDTGPTKFSARLSGDELAGNFLQGGNSAPFKLQKTGPPQVEKLPQSTAVDQQLEGEWNGEYELFGYKRHVTLKLSNQQGKGATADFVVVGRRVNNLPVDLVTQEGTFLTVDSHETGLSYEGRFLKDTNELAGVIIQGGLETPLVLHRAKQG
jgi:hypothetical protein